MAKHTLFSLLPKKYRPWAILFAIAVLLVMQWVGWPDASRQTEADQDLSAHQVVRFVDGDTIVVDVNGKDEHVRMIGVDTPETHDPDTPVQCYGAAAAAYTKNLIGDQQVRLKSDSKDADRDKYGRLLRYVYLPDGRLVAKEIISNGYGFAYTLFPFTKKSDFVAAEQQAKMADKGLWHNCTITEANGRKQTNAAE
jgi:micrococcal nuclease